MYEQRQMDMNNQVSQAQCKERLSIIKQPNQHAHMGHGQ